MNERDEHLHRQGQRCLPAAFLDRACPSWLADCCQRKHALGSTADQSQYIIPDYAATAVVRRPVCDLMQAVVSAGSSVTPKQQAGH